MGTHKNVIRENSLFDWHQCLRGEARRGVAWRGDCGSSSGLGRVGVPDCRLRTRSAAVDTSQPHTLPRCGARSGAREILNRGACGTSASSARLLLSMRLCDVRAKLNFTTFLLVLYSTPLLLCSITPHYHYSGVRERVLGYPLIVKHPL